jgi:hypothetical protein
MKSLLITLSVFFMFAAALSAQPKLRIDLPDNTIDWGIVKPDQSPLKYKVKLYNDGDEVLKIYDVKPSCGCTNAPLDKTELKPGEFATLDVSLSINAKTEKYSKSISLTTSDPDSRTAKIRLLAEALVPITIFPKRYVNLGAIPLGKENVSKIVLTNRTDKPISIKEVKSNLPSVTHDVPEDCVIPANGDLTVTLKINPEFTGNYSGAVDFLTDHPDMYRVSVHIWGRVIEGPKRGG